MSLSARVEGASPFMPVNFSEIKNEKGIFNFLKKTKGNITFLDSSGPANMKIAGEKMREIKKKREETKSVHIHKGIVRLNVEDHNKGKLVRMGVKIDDLAKFLDKKEEDIKEVVRTKHLDQEIRNKLAEEFVKSRMITSEYENKKSFESSSINPSPFLARARAKIDEHKATPSKMLASYKNSSEHESKISVKKSFESSSRSYSPLLVRAHAKIYEQTSSKKSKTNSLHSSHQPVEKLFINRYPSPSLQAVEALIDFKSYGMTEEEWKALAQFYVDHWNRLEALKESTFISRHPNRRENALQAQFPDSLPRSVGYVPDDVPARGFHVILKTHGEMEEIGRGSFNLVTLDLHVQYNPKTSALTVKEGVFRSGMAEDISNKELEINSKLVCYSRYFVAGTPVYYHGPWRTRDIDIEHGEDKQSFARLFEDTEKVGMFMDRLEGGELFEWTNVKLVDIREQCRVAAEYAEAIAMLHDLGYVHRDQKPENACMTKDGHVKVADFGMAASQGERCKPEGTRCFMPPEVVIVKDGGRYKADFAQDVWSLGCVLAEIFCCDEWYKLNNDHAKKYGVKGTITDPNILELVKNVAFPEKNNLFLHFDTLISSCLRIDPDSRPSAGEVATWLREYHTHLENTYGTYRKA